MLPDYRASTAWRQGLRGNLNLQGHTLRGGGGPTARNVPKVSTIIIRLSDKDTFINLGNFELKPFLPLIHSSRVKGLLVSLHHCRSACQVNPSRGRTVVMVAPVAKATAQGCIISLGSCLIALYLTPDRPPHVLSLVLFAALSTPPNFWWQQYLESKFPGYPLKKIRVDDGGKGVEVEKKLDVQNTIVKVILDQTVASLVNVVAFIGGTRLLRGVPIDLSWNAVREVGCPLSKLDTDKH